MLSLGCFPPRARVFSGTSACVDETGGNQAVSDHGTEAGSPLGRGFWAWRQPGETGQDFLDCGFRVTPRLSPGAWQGNPGRACLALGQPSTNAQAASRGSDRKGQGAPPHPRVRPTPTRGCAPHPPPEGPRGSTGLPGSGPLTGLGGSFWLRALWILPISVCELEWDKPSKYGLGGADGERVILQYLPELKAQPLRLAGSDAQQGPHP